MEDERTGPSVTMQVMRGCLVVPIQVELTDGLMLQIQQDILEGIGKTGVRGVVIDVSGVSILDYFLGQKIADTARMAYLMGATTVVTGLRPEVAASLVDLGFDFKDVQTALTLEEAYRKLEPVLHPEEEPEEAEEAEEPEEEHGPDVE